MDIKLMKAYQINNGLYNTLQDKKHSTFCVKSDMASKIDSMTKRDNILNCCFHFEYDFN